MRARGGPLAWGLAIVLALTGLYLLSGLVFADPGALFRDENGALPRPLRFNAVLILLIGFEIAALLFDNRATTRDFAELKSRVEAPEERWTAWRDGLARPHGWSAFAVLLGGVLFGVGINELGAALGDVRPGGWRGHRVWIQLLDPLQFACLALMGVTSLRRARVFGQMGSYVRVKLLERDAVKPFARTGLRSAAYWLVGSSLASLLALDSSAPTLVFAVVAVTLSLGLFALLLPSLGVHRRLREAKTRELTWLRRELEEARHVLADPTRDRGDAATRMPALLAYESRVEHISVWPFDVPTLVRFGLFLLLGLGSWLGGALVERLVDAALR